jgi:hypothetical protein
MDQTGPDRQIAGVAADLLRSKQELITENAFLRQQVIVLKRQYMGRVSIMQQDRRMLVGQLACSSVNIRSKMNLKC